MAALNPLPTLRAVADLDVEAPHHRTHRGQFLLVLRSHAGHFDRATAVRTRRRNRRRVHLVDPRREPTAAVTAILRTGLPPGTLPVPLRSVLGKRRRLPATRPACLVQIVVSDARSLASGGHSLVAGGCSCAATASSRAAVSPRPAPAGSTLPEAVRGRCADCVPGRDLWPGAGMAPDVLGGPRVRDHITVHSEASQDSRAWSSRQTTFRRGESVGVASGSQSWSAASLVRVVISAYRLVVSRRT